MPAFSVARMAGVIAGEGALVGSIAGCSCHIDTPLPIAHCHERTIPATKSVARTDPPISRCSLVVPNKISLDFGLDSVRAPDGGLLLIQS